MVTPDLRAAERAYNAASMADTVDEILTDLSEMAREVMTFSSDVYTAAATQAGIDLDDPDQATIVIGALLALQRVTKAVDAEAAFAAGIVAASRAYREGVR